MYNSSAYSAAMQNPILTANSSYVTQNNPNVTKFTVEQQQYNNMLQQQNQNQRQSDPYTEGSTVLSKCSQVVRQKIQEDPRYQQADKEFELLIQEYLYSQIIPNLLQHQQGLIAAEKWCSTIKILSDEYNAEEIQATKNMQVLMNDPVVLQRLQEIQNQQIQQQTQSSAKTARTYKKQQPQIQEEIIEEAEEV